VPFVVKLKAHTIELFLSDFLILIHFAHRKLYNNELHYPKRHSKQGRKAIVSKSRQFTRFAAGHLPPFPAQLSQIL
jgi:hypothetical protein